MQKSVIGTAALFLTVLLTFATVATLGDARLTEEESRAIATLKREACIARAYMPNDRARCQAIEPETGWAIHRLPIPGFFGLITWLTLGFGLAMLARPNTDKIADMESDAERARQRRLTLAAQEKLREEQAKREGTS